MKRLQVSRATLTGLSSPEALRRLAEYGPNRVEEVAGEPMLLRFLKEFTHFFALILWLAAALAFLAEWSDPGHGMAKVGYAIVAVILVSGLFSFWQEFRVERTLAALRDLLPQQVDVLREGRAVRLLADQLVPGEIVLLEQGDNIPADCRLIEAFGVRVNDATITGESVSKLRSGRAVRRCRNDPGRRTSCSPALRWSRARPRRWSSPPACIRSLARSLTWPRPAARPSLRCASRSRT